MMNYYLARYCCYHMFVSTLPQLKSHVGTLISTVNNTVIASTATPFHYGLFSTITELSCVWLKVSRCTLIATICGVDTILIAIPNFFIMTVTSSPTTIIFKPNNVLS